MSHIHNYGDLLKRVKIRVAAALTNTKEMDVETRITVLSNSILDYVLGELGIKEEPPIEPS